MEILAHTLWTTAGVRIVKNKLKNKGNPPKINIIWAAFWGVFPDLFAFTIPFVLSFYKVIIGAQSFGSFESRHQVADGFGISHTLYQYSHSLVIWILIFLFVWAILRRPSWVMLGWALHIILDIPSHSLAFFPTPFLFPISEYRFSYGVSWGTPWFMLINYLTLLVIWGSLFFKKYHKPKISNIQNPID